MAITAQPTKHSTPPRIVIHGGEKVGKSSFSSQAPRPLFLPTEEGLKGLNATAAVEDGKARLETWGEFDAALTYAENNLATFDSLVIDSGDWLEMLIHANIMATYNKPSMAEAAGGYGKAYLEALEYWHNVLMRLDRINKQGKYIIIICHSKSYLFNDPNLEPYDLWTIKLHSPKNGGGSLELLKEWADCIMFAQIETYVSETATTKGSDTNKKHRATSTGKRLLQLDNSKAFLAGNRYGMTGSCDLTWEAFMAKFTA